MSPLPATRSAPSPATIARAAGLVAGGGAYLIETIGEAMDRIHRETAPSMGGLALAISVRRIRPETLRAWARALQRGSEDMLRLAERLEAAGAGSNRHGDDGSRS